MRSREEIGKDIKETYYSTSNDSTHQLIYYIIGNQKLIVELLLDIRDQNNLIIEHLKHQV